MALALATDERNELPRRVRSLKIRAEDVAPRARDPDARRRRIVFEIEAAVPCYRDYINRWRRRSLSDRAEGLRPRYRGQLRPLCPARSLSGERQPVNASQVPADLRHPYHVNQLYS